MILTHLIKEFPALVSPENNYAQLRNLDEDAMKSPKGKEMWRNFCMTVRPTILPLLPTALVGLT